MGHVNFQAGLGLPSAEFRDWWSAQPRQDYGVDVWSAEYEFEKPNVFTIEQVQQLYYYLKSIKLTPPEVTMLHQWFYQEIFEDKTWILTTDPDWNPLREPFIGAETTYEEYYLYGGGVGGAIKYTQSDKPVGSEDGLQPDGTWVQNGKWFNRVEYGSRITLVPVWTTKKQVNTWQAAESQTSEIWESVPYTVEYNRTFRQRMKPVCIDNTTWTSFYVGDSDILNGDGTPGNALMEEIGNPGSGSYYNNPDHKRFYNFEEVTYDNPFQNASPAGLNFQTKHLKETTIMGNIHFYCLGVNPADDKIYWTISSQEKRYEVDTEIEEYGDLDFVSGRYEMAKFDLTDYDDLQFFFARTSLKAYWISAEYEQGEYGYGGITLWIPDASCDVDRLATETNRMVKRIDVDIAPGITITFIQEKEFNDPSYYPWSTGSDSDTPNSPHSGLQAGEDFMLGYTEGLEFYEGHLYGRTVSSQSYMTMDNDWEITNPVMGVRT